MAVLRWEIFGEKSTAIKDIELSVISVAMLCQWGIRDEKSSIENEEKLRTKNGALRNTLMESSDTDWDALILTTKLWDKVYDSSQGTVEAKPGSRTDGEWEYSDRWCQRQQRDSGRKVLWLSIVYNIHTSTRQLWLAGTTLKAQN